MFELIKNLTRVEILTLMGAIISAISSGFSLHILISAWRARRIKFRGQAQPKENLEPKIHSPAATAELILHLLLKDDEAEAVGGDLHERYSKKVERFGNRRAYIWLWSQVLRSIWPLVKRFFTAGGFLAAAEFIRRLLS